MYAVCECVYAIIKFNDDGYLRKIIGRTNEN